MAKTTERAKAVEVAQALDLVNLAGYQTGAIVSRQLVQQKAGSLTLFAFAAGQGLSEHTAPFDATVYIVDGQAQITISGQTHTVKKGELIIMPANQPHAVKAVKKFKMLLIMIRG